MNLDEAIDFAAASGVGDVDMARFVLFAGVYAAEPELLQNGVLPWEHGQDPLTGGPVLPLRFWRDPREAELPFEMNVPFVQEMLLTRRECRIAIAGFPDADLMRRFVDCQDIFLSIARPAVPPVRPLDWPLRIHVPDSAYETLMDRGWADTLITPVNAKRKGRGPHFIFGAPDDLENWARISPAWASMAIVFGDQVSDLPAGGLAQFPATSAEEIGEFANAFVEQLSHNETVDVALCRAALARNFPPPFIFAAPEWLESNRLSRVIKAIGTRQRDLLTVGLSRSDRSASAEGLSLDGAAAHTPMMNAYRTAEFHAESGDASQASRDFQRIRQDTADRENRFLTAEVAPLPPESQEYAARLSIWIAPLADAGASTAPDAFPEDDLTWESPMLDLDVVLFELKDQGTAQRQPITLARIGPSTKAVFDLEWSGKWFEARVLALHKNRFVQSMLVAISDGGERVTLDRECLIRPLDANLMDATPSGAAITLNDHDGPLMAVTTAAGQEIRTPTNLDETRKRMASLLMEAINDPDAFGSLTSPSYQTLLVDLAKMGSNLRDMLFTGDVTAVAPEIYEELKASESISIFSAVPTHVLPLEFIYQPALDIPLGQAGSICPRAARLLADPDTSFEDLQQGCGKFDAESTCATSDAVVCPLGFWGLRKVIERHTNRKERVEISRDYAVSASPGDAREVVNVSRLMAAATPKADANPQEAWSDACRTLAAELGDNLIIRNDWPAILNELVSYDGPPGMIVLLPHVEKDHRGIASLDLGVAPDLPVHEVRNQLKNLRAKPPLVLLLGCATGAGENPTEEFPGGFLDAGAAAVLATMTLVRGRFVAEIAESAALLTRDLIAGEGTVRLGQALLRLRQKLLASNPFVLTLIAYGDADWLLVLADEDAG